MEPILNPDDVTIPPNDRTLVEIKSQIYNENSVTGVLQPSDLLHEESDITFCAAMVTLTNGNVSVHINNFSDQPYKLKKGLDIANFSVLTLEQMKHVKPIDPVSTWHLLNENEEDAIYYVSSLLKANRNNDQYEQYWFPTPENPGDEDSTLPSNDEFSRNYAIYKKLNSWTLKTMRSHDINFLATLTGRTRCYNCTKLKRLNRS